MYLIHAIRYDSTPSGSREAKEICVITNTEDERQNVIVFLRNNGYEVEYTG